MTRLSDFLGTGKNQALLIDQSTTWIPYYHQNPTPCQQGLVEIFYFSDV